MALFYMGVAYYVYRDKIRVDVKIFATMLTGFVVALYLKASLVAMLLFFPYVMFYLAFGLQNRMMSGFGRKYELTYGIYLWGWPMQQTLIYIAPEMFTTWYVNAVGASLLAVIFGFINSVTVERL